MISSVLLPTTLFNPSPGIALLPVGALDRLQACAAAFIGEHDLSSFACLRKDGSDPEVDSEELRQC